jgi:hypothetical protein
MYSVTHPLPRGTEPPLLYDSYSFIRIKAFQLLRSASLFGRTTHLISLYKTLDRPRRDSKTFPTFLIFLPSITSLGWIQRLKKSDLLPPRVEAGAEVRLGPGGEGDGVGFADGEVRQRQRQGRGAAV